MSMGDLSYNARMPRGYSTSKGVNHEVFTTKFFGQVQDELQNEIGIQKLAFNATKWVCPGALVLVGRAHRRTSSGFCARRSPSHLRSRRPATLSATPSSTASSCLS
mmetsp:Transcript_39651/g.94871  ORF Transcript_39651/g.94871 Transcript_39651/m.94871 type:complete len:106 (-) Transcript_39651:457-774(-)